MNLSFFFCAILLASSAFATCGEGISPSFSLDTREGFALLTPADNSQVNALGISFTWEDVGAVRYELFVDDDSDFSSPDISPLSPNFRDIPLPAINLDSGWLPASIWYWKVTAVLGDNSEQNSQTFSFSYQPPLAAQPTWQPWYRLFNETRRDHFYCSSETHSDAAQILGYREEGVEGHLVSLPLDHPNVEPIYRFWWGSSTVGGHYYITGAENREAAILAGMTYEGITGYGFNTPLSGLMPLYYVKKIYTDGSGRVDNFYTVSAFERQNAITALGFTDMGILAYISLSGDMGPMPWSPWSLIAGMGISTDNGNLKHHEKADFDLPGAGPALRFSHQYNSLAVYYPDALKSLGPGWSHDYSSCIVESGGQFFVCWSDGAVHVYDAASAECLVDGVYDEMTIESTSRIEIKNKAQMRFAFERPAAGYPYLLKEIRDRNSNTLSCQYEASGLHRLTSVTDANGRSLTLAYHSTAGLESYIQSVTDPMGRQISFTHDLATGDLTSYTDPEGHVSVYGYDALLPHEHQLRIITQPDGTVIDNTYAGRKINSQLWSNQSGGMSLDYAGNSGNSTTVTYVGTSRTQSVSYLPSEEALQPRRPSASTEGANPATLFAYDNPQHPTLPSSMRDPRGNYHYYFYDARGNMIEESHPLGVNYQYTYDAFNNVLSAEDPLSHTSSYGYDGNGNLTSITQAGGHVTTLARDGRGLVSSVSNSIGTTTFAYNAQGNLITVTDALSHQSHFTVDVVGRVNAVTDANGATTQYTVDDRGLVTQVVDAMGGTMNVSYDVNGQITATNGPGASHTEWGYSDGFLTSYQTPGCPTTYAYNPDGSLASRTRPLGATAYSYDEAGRLSGIQGASNATLTRDASGNITAVDDANCDLAFTYDALNRVISTADCWDNVISYSYDAKGNTTDIVYGPGKTVHYTYDADDRLLTVTDWNGRVITYSYRPDGLLNGISYPNGVMTSYSYNVAGNLINILHQGPTGVIASYNYSLDAVSNITNVESVEPVEEPSIQADNVTYSYNGNAQLISDGTTSYAYDGNGNLNLMSGARNLSLQYDQDNRLVEENGITNNTLYYDVFGNMIQKTDGVSVKRVTYDRKYLNRVLSEYNENSGTIDYYIYGIGLVSRVGDGNISSFYHHNNIGSVVAVSDIVGSITHAYKYDSFGSILADYETSENNCKYLGQFNVTMDDNGLYNMYRRYYDPEVGRFISQDPKWDLNLYSYSNNSPMANIDPYGDSWYTVWSLVKNTVKGFCFGFNTSVSPGLIVGTEVVTIGAQVGGAIVEELSKDNISVDKAVNDWGEVALEASPDYTWAARYVRTHSGASGALGVDRIADIEKKLREKFPNYYE